MAKQKEPTLAEILAEDDSTSIPLDLDIDINAILNDDFSAKKTTENITKRNEQVKSSIEIAEDSSDEEIRDILKESEANLLNIPNFSRDSKRNTLTDSSITNTTSTTDDDEVGVIMKRANASEFAQNSMDDHVDIDTLMRSLLIQSDDWVEGKKIMSNVENFEKELIKSEEKKEILKVLEDRIRKKELNKNILTLHDLTQISEQIKDVKMKRTAGIPTCLAVGKSIAIGTTHGFVLLFDHMQALQCILGTREGVEYGSVSSIDINKEGDRLIVGHSGGQIVLWDIPTRRSLKAVTNIHKVDVCHVMFLQTRGVVLSADLSGVVYTTTFKRVLMVGYYVSDSVLVLGGAAGILRDFSVLHPSSATTHRVHEYNLVSFSNTEKTTIISCVNGSVKIVRQIAAAKDSAGKFPATCFRKVTPESRVRKDSGGTIDPILAIARGQSLQLYKISVKSAVYENPMTDIEVSLIGEHQLQRSVKAMQWLGSQTLVILTEREELLLFDPFQMEDLEILDASSIGPIFHVKFDRTEISGKNKLSSQQKSNALQRRATVATTSPNLDTKKYTNSTSITTNIITTTTTTSSSSNSSGYNISNPSNKEDMCYSIGLRVHTGRVYLLGISGITGGHLLSWEDRLSAFVGAERWIEAVALALDFYLGRAQATAGLPRDVSEARRLVGEKIEEILQQYVCVSLQKRTKDIKHFQTVAAIAIDSCVNIDRSDILFDKLFPIFVSTKKDGIFIDKLEPFILGDKIKHLPPEVIQRIIEIFITQNKLRTVEKMILHLDLASLDFHRVVKLCRQHYLSSALFYLFIHGMDEYVIPLDDHVRILMSPTKYANAQQEKVRKALGYKIFVYLSYCFRGITFPLNKKIGTTRYKRLIDDLYKYIFVRNVDGIPDSFPRLMALLKFDTKEFLNILSISFDSSSSSQRLNEVTGILINLVINQQTESRDWTFSEEQQGYLFLFIAKYVSRQMIAVEPDISERMLNFLFHPRDSAIAKLSEDALLDIIKSHSSVKSIYDSDNLLSRAEEAKFYRVSEWFYLLKRDFKKVVQCRLASEESRMTIFEYIKTLLQNSSVLSVSPSVSSSVSPQSLLSPSQPLKFHKNQKF